MTGNRQNMPVPQADPEEFSADLHYAELAIRNGQGAAALALLRDLMDSHERSSEATLMVRARGQLASALEATGDLSDAIAELESLVSVVPRDGVWVGLLLALVRCLRDSGDLARAIATGESAVAEVERQGFGDTEEGLRLALTVASAHIESGDVHYALRLCERVAARAEEIGSAFARASAYWSVSSCRAELGDPSGAIVAAYEALPAFEAVEDVRAQGIIHGNLALISLRLDPPDLEAARAHVERAVLLLTWSEASAIERAWTDFIACRVAYGSGDLEASEAAALTCLSVTEDTAPSLAAQCYVTLSHIALAHHDQEQARSHVDRAVLLLTLCGQDREIAQTWYEMGALLQETGDTSRSLDAYRRAAVSAGLTLPSA